MLLPTLLLSLLLAADPRTELLEADRAFDRETAARGLDGWMAWFAADAQANLHTGVVKGQAALREHYAKMFARPGFSIRWQPLYAEASADATLGYTFGEAKISYTGEDGKPVERGGRYVTVWRRQPGGAWKAVFDLGN
jgi:ketosteroid isomerase-like protein